MNLHVTFVQGHANLCIIPIFYIGAAKASTSSLKGKIVEANC
jgi:hypothetical protein